MTAKTQKLYESKAWRDEQNAQWHATGHQRNLTVYEMWNRAVHAASAEPVHEHQCSTHYFAHAKCDCTAIAGANHEL